MTADRNAADPSAERDELREAIAHRLFDWDTEDGGYQGTWITLSTNQRHAWLSAADALIAGPLAGLLAEVENAEAFRLAARRLKAQRDEANRKLDAVRELADDYAKDDADHLVQFGQHHPVAYHPAREIRAILDAADGGDRDA